MNITSSSVRTFMKRRVLHPAEVWRSVGRFPARKGGRGRAVAGEPGGEFHRQSSCSARPLPPPFLCAALAEAATSAGGRWVSLWTSQGGTSLLCRTSGYVAADSEASPGRWVNRLARLTHGEVNRAPIVVFGL